jgi:methyl-accepting chemotaxis protein
MEQQLRALTKALIRRRELLVTIVTVPFAISFVSSITGMTWPQLRVLLVVAVLVVLSTRLAGKVWLLRRADEVGALARRGDPESLRRAKAALVRFPRYEAVIAGSRWLVGVPVSAILTWAFVGLSGLQVAAIALVPAMVVPYVIAIAYVIAENGIAPALAGPVLAPVRLPRAQVVDLGENARRLYLALAVSALPVGTLAFLFATAATHRVEFHHLGLHLLLIGGFTALALFLVVRESSRGTNRSIDALVESIEAAARGDFARVRPDGGSTSEFGYVAQSVNALSGTIERLLRELARMSGEHEAGDVDAALEEGRFEGAYRDIARAVDEMVASHVRVNRQAMETFARLAGGDFDASLAPLPGKKRFVNETLEGVRENLRGLVAELTKVTAAHAAGDVDAALDVARFQGGFRAIAEGVNGMAADQRALTGKLLACVDRFGKGDFEAPLERFPGKKAAVNETVEQVRARLQALVADAAMLSRAALEGRFAIRAEASRHDGDYKRIVQGVNDTLDAILAPIQETAAMLDALAAGQLASRLDASRYRADARALAERVNRTVDLLLAPAEEATTVLEALARRDLRARMNGAYQGGHARMKEAVNATGASLHAAIQQVADAAAQVSSAAAQIASSSQSVAGGAAEQATALEETTETVATVAAMAARATDHAQQATALAQVARAAAVDGEDAMRRLQGTMAGIRQSAEATSQIIRDVSEIAFQTNLLALNAAVEAARAGDAGRGFAVVAEEVRALALRAKEAAQKTESLIRDSVKQAGEGEGASVRAGEKLREILGGVGQVSAIVSEMAAASREQAAGFSKVSLAICEAGKVTQQNAASAEESSSAASELSGQAEELTAMVAGFELDRATAVPRPLPAPAQRSGPAASKPSDPFPMAEDPEPLADF